MLEMMQAWKVLLCSFLLGHFIFVQGTSQVYSIPTTSLAFGRSVVSNVTTSSSLSPVANMSSSMASHTTMSVSLSPVANVSSSMASHTTMSVSLSPVANMSSSMANHTTMSVSLSPVANMSSSMANHTIMPTYSSSVLPTSHHIVPTLPVNSTSSMMSTVIPTFSPNINISSTPVMTSSVMPSSSAVPTHKPPPPYGNYTVKNSNGTSCVLAGFSVEFEFEYTNETSGKKVTRSIPLPNEQDIVANGSCPHNSGQLQESSISLTWPNENPKYNFTLVFHSEKHDSGTNVQVSGSWSTKVIEISINMTDNTQFPDAEAQTITLKSSGPVDYLNAKYGHAVRCNRQIVIPDLKDSKNTVNAKVHFFKLEIQPFDVPSSGKFEKADDCKNPPTTPPPTKGPGKGSNNTVAIAVGCTLGGLVLIVIIGYLIGRRRGRATKSAGYRKL